MKLIKENAKFIVAVLTVGAAYASTVIADENLAGLITGLVGAVVLWLVPNQPAVDDPLDETHHVPIEVQG